MDQFVIEGQKKLEGEIEILGVKNGILPMIAASILAEKGETVIRNVPNFRDVTTLSKILEKLGAVVVYDSVERLIRINCEFLDNFVAPYDLVKQMRASFLVFGPLLSRFRTAEISLPGGCAIGARNVNMHIDAFRIGKFAF
jgi:UDP-N-acetylglucosamine 1-carboxyvinyltransferase